MSGTDIHVRLYVQGDEEAIVQLLQRAFKGWPHLDLQCTPLDHWRWKYQDNPLKKKSIVVAESGGKIIGCSHGFYLKIKVGRGAVLGEQGTDLCIDEAFRGRGISSIVHDLKMKHLIENMVDLTYSLSTNPIVTNRDLRTKRPEFPSPLRGLVKIRNIDLHFGSIKPKNSLFIKLGFVTLNGLNRLKRTLSSLLRTSPSQRIEVHDVERFDERHDTFWGEVKDEHNFIVERDASYLNWRYRDRRGGDYKVKQIVQGGKISGFIVLRINRYNRDYPEGYIVDLLTLPRRLDVAGALILEADRWFSEQDINIVHALIIKGHPYEGLLDENGYLGDQIRYRLFYRKRNIGEEINDFIKSHPNKIHFEWGDLDWI